MLDDKSISNGVRITDPFESFDVLNSKFNAMMFDFIYLYDAYLDNDEHFIESYMSIFDIHFINAEPFNMGMEKNSRMMCILKDFTPWDDDKNE